MAVRKESHQTTITHLLWTTGEPRMGSHTADPKASEIFTVGRRDSLFSALSSPGFALYRVLLVAHQTWRLPNDWEVFLGCVQQQHLLWELQHLLQRRMWTGFVHPGVSLYLVRTFQNHLRPHFHLYGSSRAILYWLLQRLSDTKREGQQSIPTLDRVAWK